MRRSIRLFSWRGLQRAQRANFRVGALLTLLMGLALCAEVAAQTPSRPHVLVVKGTELGPDGQAYAGDVNDAYAAVVEALGALGLPYRTTTDGEVAHGLEDLTRPAAILLPYNRALTPAELNLLTQATHKGVRLVVFLTTADSLTQALGVQPGEAVRVSATAPTGTLSLRGDPTKLPGMPASLVLGASFCRPLTGVGTETEAVAWLESGSKEQAPEIAGTLNGVGAYLGFAPAPGHKAELGALLWAVLGKLAPGVVSETLPRGPQDIGPVGRYASLLEMTQAWRDSPLGADPKAWQYAKRATDMAYELSHLVGQGRMGQAMDRVGETRQLALHAYWAAFPSRVPEIRGVWGYPTATPNWDTAMEKLARANFNVVFPYVCSGGVAYYRSGVLPFSSRADRDLLAEAAAAAQRHGVQLHPRILALEALFADQQVKTELRKAGRLMVSSKGQSGDWLCPNDPRNREQLLKTVREILQRYPVQGVQLDYYRFDSTDTCLCGRCRAAFQKSLGRTVTRWPEEVLKGPLREQFLGWRQEVLTELLREVRAEVQAVKPGALLSVACFPDWDRHPRGFGQDPVRWAEEGLVDFLCPMNYTSDQNKFKALVGTQVQRLKGKTALAAGIGAFADGCRLETPQELADQITTARAQGAAGYVVFTYNQRFADEFLPWIRLGLTSQESPLEWRR